MKLINKINFKNSIHFLVLIVFEFMQSCNTKGNDKNALASIDSLKTIVIQTDSIFKNIKWDEAIGIENTIQSNISFIDSLNIKFKKDKLIAFEKYKEILHFGNQSNTISDIGYSNSQQKKFLRKQIDYSLWQLSNLKQDVENNNIDNMQFVKYLKSERKAVLDLSQFVLKKQYIINQNISAFNDVHPNIEMIIQKKQ